MTPRRWRRCSSPGRRTVAAGNNYFRARPIARRDSPFGLPVPPERVIAENRLRQLPGIGETIANERRVENPAVDGCWSSTVRRYTVGGRRVPLGRFGHFALEGEDRALELDMDVSQTCLGVANAVCRCIVFKPLNA